MGCTQDVLAKNWKFIIENGNIGVMSVTDPLLDTEERARERAYSEILKNGYASNSVSFSTFITSLNLNDVVEVGGVPYLIKSISYNGDSKKIIVNIGAVRYD